MKMKKLDEIKNLINLKDFEKAYCEDLLSLKDLREKFNLTNYTIDKLVKENNLVRPDNIKNAKQLKILAEKISREDLIKLYILDNNTKEFTAKYFNISMHALSQLLALYEIKKSNSNIQETRKKSNLIKYNCENTSSLESVKEKAYKTNLTKYGSKTFTKTDAGKEAIKKTKLEKYGSETYVNLKKAKQTKLQKYGDQNYNNREKAKQTFLDHYGVDNYRKSKQAKKDKQKYIIENNNYSSIFSDIFDDRDKAINFLGDKKYNFSELAEMFNCPNYTVSMWAARLNIADKIKHNGGKSSYEDEIIDFLKFLGIEEILHGSRKFLANGLELDIYLPEHGLAIEFNGTYWHSDAFLSKKYHQEKSKLAEKQGLRLIHIYEYDWIQPVKQQILKSILRSACGKVENKIYARNCCIKKLKNSEVKDFCNNNHLQGHRDAKITYGLYYKDELVQMISFSYDRKYEWEIIRSCTKLDTLIIGGVNKLFKQFLLDQNPNQVMSYCDFNTFTGISYENIGMKYIKLTAPNLHYILKSGQVINRMPHRYQELKSQVKASIYGAGSKKYIWLKTE